jgi:hypothetical protein
MRDWILRVLARPRFPWLSAAFLILPLVIAIIWGPYFNEEVYVGLHAADRLGSRTGLAIHAAVDYRIPSNSLLYTGILALTTWLGLPLSATAMVLSALGWGVMILVAYHLMGSVLQVRPAAVYLGALLLALSPAALSAAGSGVSWAVATGLLAIFTTVRARWSWQIATLALLLAVSWDLSACILVMVLFGLRWHRQRALPLRSLIVLLGMALVGALLLGSPARHLEIDFSLWQWELGGLIRESEFYWTVLLMLAVGLPTAMRLRGLAAAWLLWGLVGLLSDRVTGSAILSVAGLITAAAGVDWTVGRTLTRDGARLRSGVVVWAGALVLGLPLLIAETSSLWQRYQIRPHAYHEAEAAAAAWLRQHSEADGVVLGSARIGFLAGRSMRPWQGGRGDEREVPGLVSLLIEAPPEYVVSIRTIAWDQLTRVPWFQSQYQPVREFSSAYLAASPLIIWEKRSTAVDLAERQSVFVETSVGANLVGYQIWPWDIEAGDTVYVTLHWQATRPITEAFHTVVRLVSAVDGAPWAQRDLITPRSIPVSWWQPGQHIAERFELGTAPEIPVGAYQLNVSLREPRSLQLLALYQDHDQNPLDRVLLGYAAVPWNESTPAESAAPVEATFGDQISLKAVQLGGNSTPGGELVVTLYWEALRLPEGDYTVFVHLIDSQDAVIASHDGRPMMGRYSTLAWQPGHTVPDQHPILLPADYSPEGYRLRIGLYVPETGDRLPVLDTQGLGPPLEYVILPTG